MKDSWIIRLVGALILLAGIAVVGYLAYTAGLAQGPTAAPIVIDGSEVEAWHAPGLLHPIRGLAFFPGLLCLAPFFLCLFIFLPLRMVFGPHRTHMHMHGRWRDWACGDDDVPSPVRDWHRRLHEDETPGK